MSAFTQNLTDRIIPLEVSGNAVNFGTLVTSPSRIAIPNAAAFQGLTALTVEAVVRLSGYPASSISYVVQYHSGTTLGFSLRITTAGKLSALINNSTTGVNLTSSITIPIGCDIHIAMTWNGTTVRMFINGVLDGTSGGLSGGNTGNPAQSVFLGNSSAFNQTVCGTVDELRISKTARYSATFTPPERFISDSNTVEIFHFDEGTGSTTTGTGSNIGTFGGSPLPSWVKGIMNDGLFKAGGKFSKDSITLTEFFTKHIVLARTLTLDSIIPVEFFKKSVTKIVPKDSISFTEFFSHLLNKSLSDHITLTEFLHKAITKTFKEPGNTIYLKVSSIGYLLLQNGGRLILGSPAVSYTEKFSFKLNGVWYSKLTQFWEKEKSTAWYQKLTKIWSK